MNRRVIAIVTALLAAGLGGLIVLVYASGAEQRALAALDPVEVLIVAEPIPEGTPASALTDLVTATALPASAVGPGALTTLEDVADHVTTTAMQPGEQVLASRFADPATLATPGRVEVPEDMHEVSVLLDAPRALGGHLTAGETVGVVISRNEPDPRETHLTQHRVLVTAVQGGLPPVAPATDAATADPAAAGASTDETAATQSAPPLPESAVMVSLAVPTEDVEEIVFAAEYHRLWLTREGETVPADPTEIVTDATLWPDRPNLPAPQEEQP